jgi:hypothetical protein
LSDFERGQIIGARLAEALLGVSRLTVVKVMSAYMNHGKTISVMRNTDRKSTPAERDHHTLRRTVLKNHITIAPQVAAEPNIHLQEPVSTKTV